MVRIKPGFDGKGTGGDGFDTRVPPPNTYKGKVKRMGLAKIGSGDNVGKDRIALVLTITEGEYKGAGVLHSLNLLEDSSWSVNQFLHALTDGSERQKNAIEKLFWDQGYDVEPEPMGKLGQQFIGIGNGNKFKPIGKPVAFIVKADSYQGNPKAAIDRFLVPTFNEEEPEPVSEAEADSLEGLDEFSPETTQNPTEGESVIKKVKAVKDVAPEPDDEPVNLDEGDDDDPWT
jgi:hypothetical protein